MKILIVEDNTTILTALKQGFKYKNVITDHCTDGLEGMEKLKNNTYDLAILDLELPGMRGEEIVKQGKGMKIRTPLLILTASKDIETKAMLLEAGADDYMEKPYSFEELYARMMAILRRSEKSFPSEYLVIDDLEILPEKRIARRGKREIDLRGREYDLLKYLMCHPNQVISRSTLMEEVWGYSTSVLSNTVDTHISSLRSKIDKDFKKKLIKTIHGVGYMLEADL